MLSDKVAYLRGLMDGLGIDDSTKEGKILKMMAEILDEMAVTVEDISDEVDEIVEIVDMLDEDLGDVEDDLYDLEDDEYDEDYDEFDDDDEEEIIYDDEESEEEYDEFDDEQMFECCCSNCGDTICISESIVEMGSMKCPNCNALLEFDYVDEDDEK